MIVSALGEAKFRQLIEIYLAKTNDTIVITDGQLREGTPGPVIQYVNAALLRGSGYDAEDLIGRPLATLYPRESFPTILEQLQDTAENGQPMQHDTQSLDRNGRVMWLQVNTVPLLEANGRPLHFIRIGRDVTVRKRIEQERETTQRLLASVFGVIDQALGVVDDADNFMMVNTAVTRQLGWSVFDLIGKPFTDVIDESSRKWLKRQLAVREELDQTCRLPTELLHRNGTVIAGEIVSTIIMQPDGRQYRVITFLHRAAATAAEPAAPEVQIHSAIRDLLKRHGSPAAIVAGKVQLVGLADVREALGERWREVSASVFALAEHILRRHLGPKDACHRTADDGFLVCFAELGEEEAQDKAQLVAEEIRATLAGVAPELASARVEGFAARVSIDSSESGSDESVIQALEGRLTRERKRLEGGALEVLRGGLANAQIVLQRVRTDTNQIAPFTMVRLPKPLESALDTLRALGRSDYGLEAELLLLTGAAERLLSELTATRTDVILVPVRMSTLVQRREAERWLQIARSMAQPGKRRLVVEITELSRDTARSRMTDLVMMISSLCRAVAYELPVAEPNFLNGLPTTVPLVTIPVQRLGNEDGTGHVAAATRLTKALQNRNCRLLVKSIASPIQAMSMAKAGVPLILTRQDMGTPS
jgi:PAS domain S-box-containing protein